MGVVVGGGGGGGNPIFPVEILFRSQSPVKILSQIAFPLAGMHDQFKFQS